MSEESKIEKPVQKAPATRQFENISPEQALKELMAVKQHHFRGTLQEHGYLDQCILSLAKALGMRVTDKDGNDMTADEKPKVPEVPEVPEV